MTTLFRPLLAAIFSLGLAATISSAQLPAFPGAEGFGKFATGARGGTVYHVTTTNDTGAGSFRDAVSVSGRTVVFDIGGVLDYQAPRYAPKANVTIAGQTAPGDGVTLYGDGLSFSGSHNNVCRFLRVREGINGTSGTDAMGIANGHDMIFDHITSSWGRDETFSISGDITNITIQSSIISQGLQGHSAGGLIQTDGGVSILRTLYIDNDTRNPKVKGVMEFVNNVVCNWETIGYNMGGDSSGESFVNQFNNYFMRGPASGSTAIGGGNTDFHIYATNNWYDGNRNGLLDGGNLAFASYGSMDLKTTAYAYPINYASAHSPLTALKLAISDAGPSFKRDSVDELMMTQLTSWGLAGGTITSELVAPMSGPGLVRNGTPYADTDQDGMPNYWESGTGSNPSAADNNSASPSGSGYTRLEDYLNWLAEPHGVALQNTNVVIDLRQFTRGWVVVNHAPFWSVSNATNGTVALTNGYEASFTPTPGLNGTASFQFTVNDTDGGPITRTMNLFFTPSAQSYTPIWHGDDLANNWNALGDYNWHDGISLLYQFHNGDAALFDNTGSTNPAVNLIGSLQPALVTVNATKNYTFSGSGSLDGAMALNKTNTGTLTLNNTNGYTGNTTVSNGTLLVHGTLTASAVTVRSSGTVGGNGRLGNSLTALSGSTLTPGNGIGSPGTLTVSNTLTLSGGVTNRFDLSDDPTAAVKTNDVIRVSGNLNLTGVNVLKFTLLDGLPGNGVYTLITYSGALSGSLANFSLSGISGTLTNPPGAIAIIVNATRPPATLAWTGNGGNNFWDSGTNTCWLNDIIADKFYFGDDVVFDDTGSSNLTATLAGDVTPASVTVDAAVNYTLSGAGKITGAGGLTKTNSGTLTILTTNDYTGPTIIGSGTLSLARMAPGFGGARAFFSYRGQTRLILTAIVLFVLAWGLGFALDNQAALTDAVRSLGDKMAPVADWATTHAFWLGPLRTLLVAAGFLAVALNILRAVRFLQPIARGVTLMRQDVDARSRELDTRLAQQTKRVDTLARDAERASQQVADAEARIAGHEGGPAGEESLDVVEKRPVDVVLTAIQAWLEPSVPETAREDGPTRRIVVAVDGLERLTPLHAGEMLRTIGDLLRHPGFVTILALDREQLATGLAEADPASARVMIDRIVQIPVSLDAMGVIDEAGLARAMLGQIGEARQRRRRGSAGPPVAGFRNTADRCTCAARGRNAARPQTICQSLSAGSPRSRHERRHGRRFWNARTRAGRADRRGDRCL